MTKKNKLKLKRQKMNGVANATKYCPYCGGKIVLRSADGIYKDNSKGVMLYVCSNYPECRNIISESAEEISAVRCPKCGENMVVKSGKFGKFLACPKLGKSKTQLYIIFYYIYCYWSFFASALRDLSFVMIVSVRGKNLASSGGKILFFTKRLHKFAHLLQEKGRI